MKLKKFVLSMLAIVAFCTFTQAQKVEQFTVNANTYYGTKAIPKEICGFYQYEKTKEPIVDIKEDGTGQFQVHGVKAYPVEYWIETDEKGVIHKRTGEGTKNYQVVLILKYGSNGESGWKGQNTGKYDRIEVTVSYDMGYAIVLGERFKKL